MVFRYQESLYLGFFETHSVTKSLTFPHTYFVSMTVFVLVSILNNAGYIKANTNKKQKTKDHQIYLFV